MDMIWRKRASDPSIMEGMANDDVEVAWRYHDATKHSYSSVRARSRPLDWGNQPLPFKIYPDLQPIPLPRDFPASGVPALAAISRRVEADAERVPDLRELAHLLFFSAGITKRRRGPGGEVGFRAASCTGALYEIELYVVCRDLDGLAAGVYHFGPADFALRELRRGDFRRMLAEATGNEPTVRHAPVTIICTGTYWRNAWKYGARTYRHFGWDNGTILANLLAAGTALGLPAGVVCGFMDETVNELLGLDAAREVSFSMAPVGHVSSAPPPAPRLERLDLRTLPLSRTEVDYPIMRELHAASGLAAPEEVASWRTAARDLAAKASAAAERRGPVIPLPAETGEVAGDRFEDVVLRRGSTRRFERGAAWSLPQLSAALGGAMRGIPADFLGTLGPSAVGLPLPLLDDAYLIVHAVEGLAPGAYVLHRRPFELELLKEGRFREEAGYLGLEQDLPADASFVVFFLADLRGILGSLGSRGYRAVQLEAGILGGKLYLAAYAQRLGASGLTFYDDDVVKFFSPHAAGKSAVFCMTLGRSARRT
jgi:SagB-type dehydrogenase family enzyme